MTQRRRFLVFSSVGDRSMHPVWVGSGQTRTFDVFLCYFGDLPQCPSTSHIDTVIKRKGTKFPNLAHCFSHHPEKFQGYDAIWTVDDDIIISPAQIDRMFDIHMRERMSLSQPAFDRDSFISHHMLFQKERATKPVRLTNFVENSVTVFSKEAFMTCLPTFFHPQALTGWGMDVVWSKLLGNPICDEESQAGTRRHRIGVIDAVTCHHPARTDLNPSSLDKILPRDEHTTTGMDLLYSYGISCDDSLNLSEAEAEAGAEAGAGAG